MPRPRVYIAAPFFNPAQVSIVATLEGMLTDNGYPFYSPRLDSGSHKLTPEERKTYAAWTPVFNSNVEELLRCDILLAVVEYGMPHGHKLAIVKPEVGGDHWDIEYVKNNMELPDNGVVFECGYAFSHGKLIITFHSYKSLKSLNLMLSHSAAGHVAGFDKLEALLRGITPLEECTVRPSTMWLYRQLQPYLETFEGEVI